VVDVLSCNDAGYARNLGCKRGVQRLYLGMCESTIKTPNKQFTGKHGSIIHIFRMSSDVSDG
jgi:hypothetical protein